MVALVGAGPGPGRPTPGGPPDGRPQVTIPDDAVEVAPGVFYLGTAVDKGRVVEGYAFVRYEKGFAKPADKPGKPAPDDSECYGFLAKGAKWKEVEDYIVNPANTGGLDETFVVDNLAKDVAKWETVAGVEILGEGSPTDKLLEADLKEMDDENEVYFGDIDIERAIAVTIIWGYFRGPPSGRELIEWDQVYDDADFDWSADCEAEGEDCTLKMDFENIATHELGHSVGLKDLYSDKCSEQTMFGYADYGEITKRDLADGDIAGVAELYK